MRITESGYILLDGDRNSGLGGDSAKSDDDGYGGARIHARRDHGVNLNDSFHFAGSGAGVENLRFDVADFHPYGKRQIRGRGSDGAC